MYYIFSLFSETISSFMFQICLFKTLIRNIFQDIYCRAHKTATLTPTQHTVCVWGGGWQISCIYLNQEEAHYAQHFS